MANRSAAVGEVRVVEMVPVRVVEMVPVVEIVPVRVVEMVPVLVVEIVPLLEKPIVEIAKIRSTLQTVGFNVFIGLLLVLKTSGVVGQVVVLEALLSRQYKVICYGFCFKERAKRDEKGQVLKSQQLQTLAHVATCTNKVDYSLFNPGSEPRKSSILPVFHNVGLKLFD